MDEKQLKCIMAAILYAGMLAKSPREVVPPPKPAEDAAKMADDIINAIEKLIGRKTPPPDIF